MTGGSGELNDSASILIGASGDRALSSPDFGTASVQNARIGDDEALDEQRTESLRRYEVEFRHEWELRLREEDPKELLEELKLELAIAKREQKLQELVTPLVDMQNIAADIIGIYMNSVLPAIRQRRYEIFHEQRGVEEQLTTPTRTRSVEELEHLHQEVKSLNAFIDDTTGYIEQIRNGSMYKISSRDVRTEFRRHITTAAVASQLDPEIFAHDPVHTENEIIDQPHRAQINTFQREETDIAIKVLTELIEQLDSNPK